MKKLPKQDGFSAVEVLIALLVAIVIVVVGYFALHHKAKNSNNQLSSSNSTSAYAGWKNFCDTTQKFCFKYPSNWQGNYQTSATIGLAETVLNRAKSVNALYSNTLPAVGLPPTVDTANPLSTVAPPADTVINVTNGLSFYVSSISNPSNGNAKFKIVSGYFASSSENVPSIEVMDSSVVSSNKLEAGHTFSLSVKAFSLASTTSPNNFIIFGGGPISNATYTAAQAKAWLSSADAKTLLNIIESFYQQQDPQSA